MKEENINKLVSGREITCDVHEQLEEYVVHRPATKSVQKVSRKASKKVKISHFKDPQSGPSHINLWTLALNCLNLMMMMMTVMKINVEFIYPKGVIRLFINYFFKVDQV